MERCKEGHFYDATAHASCPYCPIAGLAVDKTYPVARGAAATNDRPEADDSVTQPVRPSDDGVTQGYFKAKLGIEPVVGWLVCVQGPARGRDYRIKSQRNFIGRDQRMDICITGDDQVSRENHAVLAYDPRNNAFKLSPGDGTGITYLNGESVDSPMPLKPFDLIELGQTHLRFVPFCGDEFQWK